MNAWNPFRSYVIQRVAKLMDSTTTVVVTYPSIWVSALDHYDTIYLQRVVPIPLVYA